MRIKITLQTKGATPLFIPYQYNHIIQGVIYSTLEDSRYRKELHDSTNFKYFTFSKLYMYDYKHIPNLGGFMCKKGKISFIISSPSEQFVHNFINGLINNKYIQFQDTIMEVINIKTFTEPCYNEYMNYNTISAILVRKPYINNNGKLKAWDLNPADQEFFTRLEENSIKKYNQFNKKIKYTSDDIHISSNMRYVKGVRIGIRGDNTIIYNRCYFLDVNIKAPIELQKFIYNVGLGEKTSMGFGCLEC